METTHEHLTLGTEVIYTGDMANIEGRGVIVARHEDRWGKRVDIESTDPEDKRKWRGIHASNFNGPGARFVLRSVYDAERARKIEIMKHEMAAVMARKKEA